ALPLHHVLPGERLYGQAGRCGAGAGSPAAALLGRRTLRPGPCALGARAQNLHRSGRLKRMSGENVTPQLVGQASRLSAGRLALGATSTGGTPGAAGIPSAATAEADGQAEV